MTLRSIMLGCLGCLVACGGGGPSTDVCTMTADCPSGQRCVDDRCVVATERDAGCMDCECRADDDCPAVAPCAESRCSAGRCEVVTFDERCAPLGVCESIRGCVARDASMSVPDAGSSAGEDAGADAAVDAGLDAGSDGSIDGGPTRGPVGAACSGASSCLAYRGLNSPQCLMSLRDGTSFTGGYCSLRCVQGSDCPSGTACWRKSLTESYCMDRCTEPLDCRLGYACRVPPSGSLAPAGNVCYPGRSIEPPAE